ncbi:MAG: hypothetical protein P4N59_05530 [Negativicutes bacterium]|nr:hypothetical protein [Negativicutes bacterium]
MTTPSPNTTMAASVISDEVYHSSGDPITINNVEGWVPVIDKTTGLPMMLNDPVSGYYGEVWGIPNGSGGYSQIMQANRGTVIDTPGTNTFSPNDPTAVLSGDVTVSELLDDAGIATANALGLNNLGVSGVPDDYVNQAQDLYAKITTQYGTNIPLIETGQSLGGYTAQFLVVNNIANNSNILAITSNALPFTASAASAYGFSSSQIASAQNAINNNYVGNEQLTQSDLLGSAIGNNVTLGNLPDNGPDVLNSLTIHSADSAVAETLLAEYTPGTTAYNSAVAMLATAFSNASSFPTQATIAAVLAGGTPAVDSGLTANASIGTDGLVSFGDGATSVLYSSSGAYAVTTQAPNSIAASYVSQTLIYNQNDQQIGSATLNTNGTTNLVGTDSNGNQYGITFGSQGKPVAGTASVSTSMGYSAFVSAVIDTLATQIISQVLIKNNLPVSIVASAFASATIKSITTQSTGNFNTDFANAVVGIAGGIAGSDVGVLVAKALGVPVEAGSIVGGIAGNLLTQAVVNEVANELGYASLTSVTFGADAGTIAANFGNALEGAGGGLLGSYLGSLIAGTSEDAQLGGAAGGAVGGIIGSLVPVVGTFIGAVIGSFLGDLLGGLFDPPRGNPFVQAGIGISNGKFVTLEVSADNNGNVNDGYSIGASLNGFLNQVLISIGGVATGSATWNIGYGYDLGIFSLVSGVWPPSQRFATLDDAIADAAYHLLRSVQITGGNPVMMWELETSTATNMTDLLTDMGIAQNYALYSSSPLAVDVAIAASGNATNYTNLQNQLASAQTLGLNRLTYDGTTLTINTAAALISGDLATLVKMPGTPYAFTFADTAANMVSVLTTLESQASAGHLASIAFTDTSTPTLTLSAAQIGSNLAALQTMTGSYVINVSDTAANIAANLNALQVLAAGGHLNSLVMTDAGTPSITLSAAQIGGDVTALALISHAYKVVVQDTTANISANFSALEAAQAAGHLTSITATDSTQPVLGISYAQYTGGMATLALVSTAYSLGLADTSANVEANLAALQSLVTSGKLVSVKFTDATPALSVTVAQTTGYASLLALMAGEATINVTGIAANTSYTITGNGLTIPLAVGATIQSSGTNSFLDTLNGSNLTVTLANSRVVVGSTGVATFTTPLTGFGSSVLSLAVNGTATFTVGSDNLTFQTNSMKSVLYASGAFSFGVTTPSTAYTEAVTWNPTTGQANLVLTATGGQAVTTSLGQVNPGTVFSVTGTTITNTNSSSQLLYSTTINSDGSQADTVYNYSGGSNKDAVTMLNASGQQTATRWDHTDGSYYISYVNPTTQAVIANLTVNANGSGSISTANSQTITFAAGNVATATASVAGDTVLTLKTSSGSGITETFELTSGQIVSSINGNSLVYTLANAGAAIDASGNVTITGGGSTLTFPASGASASFVVGTDILAFPQNVLQNLTVVNGSYVFGLASPASQFSENLTWNPTTGIMNLMMTPTGGQVVVTPLGLFNPGNILSISSGTISIKASNGTVIASTTVNSDGSQSNTFNNAAGALHVAANGVATFVDGSDNLTFQPNVLQSWSSANGIFSFVINPVSTAYSETITWNPTNGMASLVLTATGKSPVTTSLGQVNPGTVFSVSGSTITNTNSAGQKLYFTIVNSDGSQVDTIYSYSGNTTATITTLNTSGQQTATRWNNTNGSVYTSYTNPTTQAVIANFSVNADTSGYVATNNNQTINFAAGNSPSVSIGSAGDTLLTLKTSAGITETLDMSSGKIVSTVNGNVLTYTLANAGASIDSSGNVTITGGGSTILLPANGGNATFTVGQDSLSFPQNVLSSLSSVNGVYMFAVTSSVTGFNESISWNPTNGMASLVLTPTAGGSAITTSIGQINPGNVLSISGPYITIAGSTGTAISSTTVNSDGSQVNIFYNNSSTVNETVTITNTAGQITSVRSDNANGSTYTSYYNPTTHTIIANRSVNADGSGYVATANNQTVNFTSSSLFTVSIDASGNPLITVTPLAGNGAAETLYLTASQITSTINGVHLAYSLPSPAISYNSLGNLTLTASGSTLVLPANGSNYIFTVGQDTISLAPASVTSITPNGTSYNFNLAPVGSASEYVTWNPQTGVATLNITPTGGSLTSTNMGNINPGYVLNVSNSLITNTNASGQVINAYAVQANGSVISTASSTTYNLTISNSLLGLSGSDTVTITGSGNTIYASQGDTITLQSSGNTVIAKAGGATINNVGSSTNTYKIADTAANIVANLTYLTANAGNIASISLTDNATPTLGLTAAQYTADAAALAKISSAYNLAITGVSAANAATIAAQAHVSSLTISDSAANVVANIVALESLATGLKLSSITLTDSAVPTLSLTASQFASDSAVLGLINSSYSLSLSGGGSIAMGSGIAKVQSVNLQAAPAGQTQAAYNFTANDIVGLVVTDNTFTNDTITAGNGGDTLNAGSGVDIFDVGNASGGTTVYASAGDTVNVSGNGQNGTNDIIQMSNGAINVAANANILIGGLHDTVVAGANDDVAASTAGSIFTIGSNSNAWIWGDGSSSGGDTINVVGSAGGALVEEWSTGNTVNVSGNGQNGVQDSIEVSGCTVNATDNSALLVTGLNDTIIVGANVNMGAGTADSTYTIGSNSDVWIWGDGSSMGGDTINIIGSTGGALVEEWSTGDIVNVSGNGQSGAQDSIEASGCTINAAANSAILVTGLNDTINAGANVDIGASTAGSTFTIGSNSNAWIWGDDSSSGGDTINVVGSAGGTLVEDWSTGDIVNVSGNGQGGTQDSIEVSGSTVNAAANSALLVTGLNDTVIVGANVDLGASTAGSTFTIGSGSNAWIWADGSSSGGDTINVVGSGGTFVEEWSTGDTVNVSGNGQTGTADTINMASGTVVVASNSNVSITGAGNTITAGQNDTVAIASGNNTLIAGTGGDIFTNSGGSTNVYKFGTGFGADTINNLVTGGTTAMGQVAFLSGITDEKLWFKQSGSNLEIDLLGTTSKITLTGWYGSNTSAQVQSFTANGITLLNSQVAQLVSAMATYAANNTGFNVSTATAMPTNTTLQNAIAASWH